jgi:hypothetical protein
MKKQGLEIKDDWIKLDTVTFKIPSRILDGLGIIKPPTALDISVGNNYSPNL